MNKLAFLALASLAVVGGASAQTKTPSAKKPAPAKAAKAPAKISCAVMKGDMVDVAKATKSGHYADYKGRRYFFCCEMCPTSFKKDPAKYAKTAPSIAIPKAK